MARVKSVTWENKSGKKIKGEYFSGSSVACPKCINQIPRKDKNWIPEKPKVGLSCCGLTIVEVVIDKAEKTKREILYKGIDNRGNPFTISTCFGQQDFGRKGEDCKLPCIMVGGTNIQTNSARSHTIHLPKALLKDVIETLTAKLGAKA